MDITVFKLEVDDPTFNTPFSGNKRSVKGEQDDSSGKSVKCIVGLGTLLVATVLGGAIVLKRRLSGEETEADEDHAPTIEETEDESRGSLGALLGLFFLIVVSVAIKKRRDSKKAD